MFLFSQKTFLWCVTKLGLQKFQLLITLGEDGLRIERWEGGQGLDELIFFLVSFAHFILFFPSFGRTGFPLPSKISV